MLAGLKPDTYIYGAYGTIESSYDSGKQHESDTAGSASGWHRGERRKLAGAQSQRETAALGTAEPATPERAATAGRGPGIAAKPREIAGAIAPAAGCGDRRTWPLDQAHRRPASRGNTPGTSAALSIAAGRRAAPYFT